MALTLPVGDERPPSADRVPTLTEVVELGHAPALDLADPAVPTAVAIEPTAVPLEAVQQWRADPSAELIDRVLAAVAPRVDEVVDTWLREALEPALARAVEALVLDARQTLAGALRDAVQDAVQQTLEASGAG